MLAAKLMEPGRLEVRRCPTPACPEGGVLVRVKCCGLCSADARMVGSGHRALSYPRVPGHEMTGVVEETRLHGIEPGLRVQVAPGLRCGVCRFCLRGDDHQCLHREVFGFSRDGGYAELVPVPLQEPLCGAIHALPDNVDFTMGTLAEPLACCLNAQSKLSLNPTDRVLVMGGGILGILHALAAREKGVAGLAVSEPLAERRRRAEESGVELVLDTGRDEVREGVMDWSHGLGADVIILASSEVILDQNLFGLLARGGRVSVFSGGLPEDRGPCIPLSAVHYREAQLSGSYGCRSRDNQSALEIIAARPGRFSGLIDNLIDLQKVDQGLKQARNRTSLKTVLEMRDG
jgi:L-iditol 2-dehydrogenase